MLKAKRKSLLALTAAVSLMGTAALALDHEVVIIDGAYFPPLVHAEPGDRLIFINNSSGTHVVQASDESWTSGPIAINGTFTLTLEEDTPLMFNASVETEGNGEEDGDIFLEQIGEITYEPVPIN